MTLRIAESKNSFAVSELIENFWTEVSHLNNKPTAMQIMSVPKKQWPCHRHIPLDWLEWQFDESLNWQLRHEFSLD